MGTSKHNHGSPVRIAKARNVKRERNLANENTVGMVTMFAGEVESVPIGWLLCDGSEVLQTAFPELYALIGTIYGTSGTSGYFVLPDFTDRVPIGAGSGWNLADLKAVKRDSTTTDYNLMGIYFIIRAY